MEAGETNARDTRKSPSDKHLEGSVFSVFLSMSKLKQHVVALQWHHISRSEHHVTIARALFQ